MVSFSDGEDPHFRKATFEPKHCPDECPRPCEAICPAAAIAFSDVTSGVIEERCYGCGRCLPICPIQHIGTVTRATTPDAIAPQLLNQVDAIEIHTHVGRYDDFMALWSVLRPYLSHLKLISISCPDDEQVVDYLWQLYRGIQPLSTPLIWQTDGRPMSGDIGNGTTHATLRYAQKILQAGPPGFVQLAGGTNAHTVPKLRQLWPVPRSAIAGADMPPEPQPPVPSHPVFGGVAYGSFARRLMHPWFAETPSSSPSDLASAAKHSDPNHHVLPSPDLPLKHLIPAVQTAHSLVAPLKAVHAVAAYSPPHPVNRP